MGAGGRAGCPTSLYWATNVAGWIAAKKKLMCRTLALGGNLFWRFFKGDVIIGFILLESCFNFSLDSGIVV